MRRISAGALAIAVAMMWLTANTTADQQAAGASGEAGSGVNRQTRRGSPTRRRALPTASPILAASGAMRPTRRSSARRTSPRRYTPEEFKKVMQDAQARDETQTTPGTADVLRLHAVRPRQEPAHDRPEPAHVADHRSAGRPSAAAGAGSSRARAGAGRGTQTAGRPVRSRAEHAERLALHHHGRRWSSAPRRRLQQHGPIVQGQGNVMVLTEMIHDARIIPLDNRPAPPSGLKQWVGMSRGRWKARHWWSRRRISTAATLAAGAVAARRTR